MDWYQQFSMGTGPAQNSRCSNRPHPLTAAAIQRASSPAIRLVAPDRWESYSSCYGELPRPRPRSALHCAWYWSYRDVAFQSLGYLDR